MYKLLLILKYLRRRRIAWVSLIAVMLCTAMVLVVISVMGGWLRQFNSQFKGLTGDITVSGGSWVGFPHYQEMIQEIQQIEGVKAAAPVVRTFGLININGHIRKGVEVVGYPPDIQKVNGFRSSLYRIGGNYSGVLAEAKEAAQLLKQPNPEEAAEKLPLSADLSQANFVLIAQKRALNLDEAGNRLAREYLAKNADMRRVSVRAREIIPLSVKELGGNSGALEGYLIDNFSAASVMDMGDPAKAARDIELSHIFTPTFTDPNFSETLDLQYGFGLVVGDEYYRFDRAGNVQARKYLREKVAALEGELAKLAAEKADEYLNQNVPRKTHVAGDKGEKVYEVRAISRADRIDFSLWSDGFYAPPLGYKGGRDPKTWEGAAVGAGVVGIRKDKNGIIRRPDRLYTSYLDVTVLPIPPDSSTIDPTAKARNIFWIVDDSRTKVHLYDSNTVYVPFATLQRDLQMDGTDGTPARVREIQIALKDGVDPNVIKKVIEDKVNAVRRQQRIDDRFPTSVMTWREMHSTFLDAVEKEKGLVTLLFGFISIVAVFLIFCIFYMIVVEKTRDIGIIKSVGATAQGIAGVFLGYGAAIGIVGSGLGLLLAWLIVHNINFLHDQMNRLLGFQMWNPEVYLFETIPNTMDPLETTVIVSIAIIASVLGALVPAIRAARLHPIEALRWE